MTEDEKQIETFGNNIDELDSDKKNTLLSIGEKLMSVQRLINTEKISATKKETDEKSKSVSENE